MNIWIFSVSHTNWGLLVGRERLGNGWGLGSQRCLVTNGSNNRPLQMRARAMEARRKRIQETVEVDQQDLVTDETERIKEREESQITPGF